MSELEGQASHIAIIMDGNGRWAKQRGLARHEGHSRGVETTRQLVRAVETRGIHYLTLYAFSSENWSRPRAEIDFLMGLIRRYIESDLADLHARNVKIRIIGQRQGLSRQLSGLIDHAEATTANNTGLILQIAFNYGAREEILHAAMTMAEQFAAQNITAADFTEQRFSQCLFTHGVPDPDLIIRTSGELRLSNFLLWQAAYSEFYFCDVLWPDFNEEHLDAALASYAGRERRFGDVPMGGHKL